MIDHASGPTRGAASGAAHSVICAKTEGPGRRSRRPRHNNVAQIAREPGAGDRACGNAFVDESLDSEFSMQKSSSSDFARQLIGVMTIPANWHAQ